MDQRVANVDGAKMIVEVQAQFIDPEIQVESLIDEVCHRFNSSTIAVRKI